MKCPVDKLGAIRAAAAAGQWGEALRIAASMSHLGKQRGPILTARGAMLNPDFYLELGRNPDALFDEGVKAMKERWSL